MAPLTWISESFTEALAASAAGDCDKVVKLCRPILAALPVHAGALGLLGSARLTQGEPAEAASYLEEAVRIDPTLFAAWLDWARALQSVGDRERAGAVLAEAGAHAPREAGALTTLANRLQDAGRFEAALDRYEQAAAIDPGNAVAQHNLGLALLLEGRYREGWPHYAWRWQVAGLPLERHDVPVPAWSGEPLDGLSLLLWAEQGLGDTIHFCRLIPRLADQGARVHLLAPPSLHPLLASLEGLAGLHAEGDPLPAFDRHLPLLALPGRLDLDVEAMAGEIPYLAAPRAKIEAWRERLGTGWIGLCWRGNPHHRGDAARSLALEQVRPLAEHKLVSLQIDATPDEIAAMGLFDAAPMIADWSDTAALVETLDLVITVDTSVAHLAGALGRPVWTLVPFVPDWRWGRAGARTPWYPSMRLIRQPEPGDWLSVVDAVLRALDD